MIVLFWFIACHSAPTPQHPATLPPGPETVDAVDSDVAEAECTYDMSALFGGYREPPSVDMNNYVNVAENVIWLTGPYNMFEVENGNIQYGMNNFINITYHAGGLEEFTTEQVRFVGGQNAGYGVSTPDSWRAIGTPEFGCIIDTTMTIRFVDANVPGCTFVVEEHPVQIRRAYAVPGCPDYVEPQSSEPLLPIDTDGP